LKAARSISMQANRNRPLFGRGRHAPLSFPIPHLFVSDCLTQWIFVTTFPCPQQQLTRFPLFFPRQFSSPSTTPSGSPLPFCSSSPWPEKAPPLGSGPPCISLVIFLSIPPSAPPRTQPTEFPIFPNRSRPLSFCSSPTVVKLHLCHKIFSPAAPIHLLFILERHFFPPNRSIITVEMPPIPSRHSPSHSGPSCREASPRKSSISANTSNLLFFPPRRFIRFSTRAALHQTNTGPSFYPTAVQHRPFFFPLFFSCFCLWVCIFFWFLGALSFF